MSGLTNSCDGEGLVLPLGLLQLSPDDFDEQIVHLPPKEPASANHTSRPHTPPDNEAGDLILALISPPVDSDELATRSHRTGSTPTGKEARPSAPHNESDEKLALAISQPLADNFIEQAGGLNQWKESRPAIEDSLASLLAAKPSVKVQAMPSSYLRDY